MGIYADSVEPMSENGAQASNFSAEVCSRMGSRRRTLREGLESGWCIPESRWCSRVGAAVWGNSSRFSSGGLGGRLGSGRQMMSWIHLDDLLAIFYRMMYDEQLVRPGELLFASKAISRIKSLRRVLGKCAFQTETLAVRPRNRCKHGLWTDGARALAVQFECSDPRPKALDSEIGFRAVVSVISNPPCRFETGKPFKHSPPFHPTPLCHKVGGTGI
jgi:hypothetical protein